ncbi:MAG: bifunctional diaminohydroxyphosphoribosylaminopyrimidine deaminase/5-amino-6-(5-phosphoribosylamino)uracil reductase RibD [Geobacteraceae bacterium]
MPDNNEKFMRRAIVLARKGIGKTAPNPAVGCIIVKDGVIVGEGWHRRAGAPHAEAHALKQAGDLARGADVYVNLEPCAHTGRTPPCADALVEAGVARVFAGIVDPNPKVRGQGLARLTAAGIAVTSGILEDDCHRLNEPFIKHITTGRPFVIFKSALTLDGKTATTSGNSKWITSYKSRHYVHKVRAMVDAVMVGIGTVVADDPQLTARFPGSRDPLRVVLDSGLRIPAEARVLSAVSNARTIIATTLRDSPRIRELEDMGAEVIHCSIHNGRVDLHDLLDRLGKMGVQSLILEGGATLAGEFLRLGLIDKFLLFYAPKLIGGDGIGLFTGQGAASLSDAVRLRDIRVRRFDSDILIEAYAEDKCLPV